MPATLGAADENTKTSTHARARPHQNDELAYDEDVSWPNWKTSAHCTAIGTAGQASQCHPSVVRSGTASKQPKPVDWRFALGMRRVRSSPTSVGPSGKRSPKPARPAGQRPNDLRTLNESYRERRVLKSSRERNWGAFASSRRTCWIMAQRKKSKSLITASGYGQLLSGISELLESARRTAARRVNNILTATYWEIGRRIVEHELSGQHQARLRRADHRSVGSRPGSQAWPGVFAVESLSNARLLHGQGDFPDTVWTIGGTVQIS